MPTYTARITAPPTITPTHHTFHLRIYKVTTGPDGPTLEGLGDMTFTKNAGETWPQTQQRFGTAMLDYLASHETALSLQHTITDWLDHQYWET